jgi:hypothetical protein
MPLKVKFFLSTKIIVDNDTLEQIYNFIDLASDATYILDKVITNSEILYNVLNLK